MPGLPDIATDNPQVILFVISAAFFIGGIFCEGGRRLFEIDCVLWWILGSLFLFLGILFTALGFGESGGGI